MNITKFIKRIQSIIAEPQREFIRIAKEDKNPGSVLIEFTIPLIALYILTSYLGRIVFSPATFNVGTGVILKNIFMIVIVTILGIYLSAIAINEILPFFHSKKNKTKSFALVTYSMTPILLALIFSGLIPKLATLIYFIGFYSVFLFWISSAAIIDMTKERRQIFVPLSLLLIMIIFLLLRIVLGAIFSL